MTTPPTAGSIPAERSRSAGVLGFDLVLDPSRRALLPVRSSSRSSTTGKAIKPASATSPPLSTLTSGAATTQSRITHNPVSRNSGDVQTRGFSRFRLDGGRSGRRRPRHWCDRQMRTDGFLWPSELIAISRRGSASRQVEVCGIRE